MAFKCLNCGHIFDECEVGRWVESRGECWGFPCSEEMHGCPLCGDNYEETVGCEICGGEFLKPELSGGVCEDCIDNYRKDFKMCKRVSTGEETEIRINSLLASLFDVGTIEAILCHYIESKEPDVDCSVFIDSDMSWFGERLAEEVKRDENGKK